MSATNYNQLLTMTDGIGTTSYGYLAVTNTQLGAGQLASVDLPAPRLRQGRRAAGH